MHSFPLNSLRKNSKRCHSEPRSVFERGEEPAFSLVFLRTADPSPANDAGSGLLPQPAKDSSVDGFQHPPAFSIISLLASCPPGMWLLVHLAEVSVVANIVVAPAAVLFAASLPLSRQTINRTSLRTSGMRSVVFEDDQSHEHKRDDADTETDEQVCACQVRFRFRGAHSQNASYIAQTARMGEILRSHVNSWQFTLVYRDCDPEGLSIPPAKLDRLYPTTGFGLGRFYPELGSGPLLRTFNPRNFTIGRREVAYDGWQSLQRGNHA